jgi:hypothetical protein
LAKLTVELLAPADRPIFDELLATRHYLKNPTAVGQVLRYVCSQVSQAMAGVVGV